MSRTPGHIRVAFLTNIVPPYRTTFYTKLFASGAYEGRLIRGVVEREDGRPDHRGPVGVSEAQVRNREWRIGPYHVRWQAGALTEVRSFDPQLVVLLGLSGTISNWLVLLWAKLRARKVLIWACGWEPQRAHSIWARLKHFVSRSYFSAADRCLVYSTKGYRYLAAMGVPRRRLGICHNGIEIDDLLAQEAHIRLEAQALRGRLAPHPGTVFLYVGGMLAEKRVDLLLEAFARIERTYSGVALWLIGDGPDRRLFEARCRNLQIVNARFMGRIIDGVDKYFAAADFFVLPGLGGLALNQAMFWGTPCVSSEGDGTEDDLVIDGYTGIRFTPGDPQSLEEAMRRCLALGEGTRRAWRAVCRNLIVERSNVNRMVEVFTSTIDELTRGHGPVADGPDAA